MLIILECEKSQIAGKASEINENTKAYVDPIESGVLNLLWEQKIEHVYAKFPEERFSFETQTIGGKTPEELKREIEAKRKISPYGKNMMESKDFTTLKNPENLTLVRCGIKALGIKKDYPTTDEIFARIQELGGILCPAEVGPHKRLTYVNQPMGECVYIAMKPIVDRFGIPRVFALERVDDGLWLSVRWALPAYKWDPGLELVFGLSKQDARNLGIFGKFLKH